jgi:acyl carrier protein
LTAVTVAGPDRDTALVRAAAALHAGGCRVDWDALLAGRGSHVSAPGHPWQRRRHWIDTPAAPATPTGPLPVERTTPALGTPITPYDSPLTRHYPVNGSGPADPAAMAALLLAAGSDLLGGVPLELRDVDIAVPLVPAAALTASAGAHLTAVTTGADRTLTLVPGRHGGHDPGPAATARLSRPADPQPRPVDLDAVRARPAEGARTDRTTELLTSVDVPSGAADPLAPAGTSRLTALLRSACDLLASCLSGRDPAVAEARAVRVWEAPSDGEVLVHAVAEGDDTGRVRLLAADGRVLAELTGVRYVNAVGSAVPEDVRRRVADRLHTVRWQPVPPPPVPAGAGPGRWLVAAAGPGDGPAAEGLTAALTRAGADARAVGEHPDWTTLAADTEVRGIVLAAASPATGHRPLDGPERSGTAADPVLAAARAAVRADVPPRLWLVTRGARDPHGLQPPDPRQAAAWGLLRVLAMEAPDAWGGCLDLPALTERDYDAAATRLLAAPPEPGRTVEDELVLRDGTWYAPRLVPAEAPPERLAPLHCRRDGWYLVVGAPSAVARPVVERLVAAGARRLLLVRAGEGAARPDDRWAEELGSAGADVKVADPTAGFDGTETDEEVFAAVTGGEPIAGVVVAPPPPPVRPLTETDPSRLAAAEAFAELVARLERGLRGRRLDFFHVLGSAAASWGAAGMAVSAALDEALSAVAAARSAAGRAAAVLRWMPHADGAELTRRDLLMMENSGLSALTTADVTEAADLLVRGAYTDVSVARVDGERYAAACRDRTDRGFLELLGRSGTAAEETEPGTAARPPLVARLLALGPALRGDVLLERVLAHVTDVLGEGAGGEVDPERGFFELGMDSVMAVALKSRLDEELGVDLPATLTFEFPTARALARHLLDGLRGTGAEPAADSAPEPAGPAPDDIPGDLSDDALEDLSDDELMERLMAGLAASERLLEGEG